LQRARFSAISKDAYESVSLQRVNPKRVHGLFLNRFGEIRSGWRIALFLVLLIALGFPLQAGLNALPFATPLIDAAGALAAAVGVSWIIVRFINRKPLSALGLGIHPGMPRELGIGLLLGFLLMGGIFAAEVAFGYVQLEWRGYTVAQSGAIVLYSLAGFGVSAAFEELLFRGYIFQTLIQAITFLPAMILLSLLFALGHIANPSSSAFSSANVFLAGVCLSFAYMKTRSLWLPFGLHWSWNFCQTTVLGYPTSGLGFSERRLLDQVIEGPTWITGGDFGPEGGVLATICLAGCTWYLLKSRRVSVPEGIVTLDSLEDVLPTESAERIV
jgi:uncharacterized protein